MFCRFYGYSIEIQIIPCMFPVKKHEQTPPLRCFAMLRQGGGNAKEAAETAEVLELLALAALPEELELCLNHGGYHRDVMVLFMLYIPYIIYIYI